MLTLRCSRQFFFQTGHFHSIHLFAGCMPQPRLCVYAIVTRKHRSNYIFVTQRGIVYIKSIYLKKGDLMWTNWNEIAYRMWRLVRVITMRSGLTHLVIYARLQPETETGSLILVFCVCIYAYRIDGLTTLSPIWKRTANTRCNTTYTYAHNSLPANRSTLMTWVWVQFFSLLKFAAPKIIISMNLISARMRHGQVSIDTSQSVALCAMNRMDSSKSRRVHVERQKLT